MKLSIGVDIEEVARFRTKNPIFLKKLLSRKELGEMRAYSAQRVAGMFCAKEAIIKACGTIEKIHVGNIEILHRKNGAPYASINGSKKISSGSVSISISHTKAYAAAVALVVVKK